MRVSCLTPEAMLLPSLPLEGRAGEGVVQWTTDGPPPSIPPLKGEGRLTAAPENQND